MFFCCKLHNLTLFNVNYTKVCRVLKSVICHHKIHFYSVGCGCCCCCCLVQQLTQKKVQFMLSFICHSPLLSLHTCICCFIRGSVGNNCAFKCCFFFFFFPSNKFLFPHLSSQSLKHVKKTLFREYFNIHLHSSLALK